MRVNLRSVGFVFAVLAVVGLGGCSTSRLAGGDDVASATVAMDEPLTRMVRVSEVVDGAPCAPAPQQTYYRKGVRDSLCGLPCEKGCGNWHVRGLGGWPFFSGDDATLEGCSYFGLDVGRTWPCCFGVDLFARTFGAEADRWVPIPGALGYAGTDSGRFYTLGLKATWQGSFSGSRWFWYVGAGPEVFWARDYLVDDEGIGGFAEIGLGYRIAKNWRIRAGLDVHVLSTKTAHEDPWEDDESRLLWVFAPVIGVEVTF